MRDEFPFKMYRKNTFWRSSRGIATGAAAALGALAGCGDGGSATPSTNDGGSPNTTPVNLSVDAGSPIVPINLPAGYFRGSGDAPLTFDVDGLENSGLMFDASTGRISGTVTMAGEVVATVTATGGEGGPVSRTFTITAADPVAGAAARPTFTDDLVFRRNAVDGMAIDPIDVGAGFADPDGGEDLTFEVEFVRNDSGLIFDDESNTISGTFDGTEDVTAIVTITNGAGENATSLTHRLLISPSGGPVVSATRLADVTATEGEALASPIDLRPGFDDPDGEDGDLSIAAEVVGEGGTPAALSTVGLTLTESTLSGTPNRAGNIVIRVTATDAGGEAVSDEFTIAVAENPSPMVVGNAPAGFVLTTGTGENLPIEAAGWFTAPDAGQTLTYSLVEEESFGLGIDEQSGRITGTFTGAADVTIGVRASDGRLSVDHTLNITANAAPATTDAAPTEALVLTTGTDLNLPLPVSGWFGDADTDATLTYSLVNPTVLDGTGLTFDAGEFRGGFTGNPDSMVEVEVRAADEHGVTVDHTLNIEGNAAPTESQSAPTDLVTELTTGTNLNLPIDARGWFVDPDGNDSLSFTLENGDGTGLSIDSDSGQIRGEFIGTGDTTIRVRAADEGGASVVHAFDIVARKPFAATNMPDSLVFNNRVATPPIDLSRMFDEPAEGVTRTYGAMVGGETLEEANIGLSISPHGILTGTFTGTGDTVITLTANNGLSFEPEQSITVRFGQSRNFLSPNDDNEILVGASSGADDVIFGGSGNDLIYGGLGSDSLFADGIGNVVGDSDTDVALYSGRRDDYNFHSSDPVYAKSIPDPRALGISLASNEAVESGIDKLFGIDEVRFEDQAFVVSEDGTPNHDIVLGTRGNDMIAGGAGDDILYAGSDGDDDIAVYSGDIRDFRFEQPELLAITDADAADGTDEGSDRLDGYEKVRFADNVELNTGNIIIGSDNSKPVKAKDGARSVLYGEGGGFMLNGGTGADIFQFLTSADSTGASMTTISGFESNQDRIALGREIGTVTVADDGVNTTMSNSSGFSLTIEGTGLNLALDGHYWFIGGAPAANSAVRAPIREEISAFAIDEERASASHAVQGGAVPSIAEFAVDGDDAGTSFGIPAGDGVPTGAGAALFAEPDVPGDAVAPSMECNDYVCSLGLV